MHSRMQISGHIGIVVGGIIPEDDETDLLEKGVHRVFHPGSSLKEISEFVKTLAVEVRTNSLKQWEGAKP